MNRASISRRQPSLESFGSLMAAYDLNNNESTWDYHPPHPGRKKRRRPRTNRNGGGADSDENNSFTATTLGGETKTPTAPHKPKPLSSASSNYRKKSDPATAAKLTRPCSECGKRFWSWKALFGHMRCHPERQWRGINPPANFRLVPPPLKPFPTVTTTTTNAELSSEEREVAQCLVMLAGGGGMKNAPLRLSLSVGTDQRLPEFGDSALGEPSAACDWGMDVARQSSKCRFECSSCKRVFGSHQALGGHRASHKNVKGCFAISNSEEEEQEREDEEVKVSKDGLMLLGHKCSVCFRVFSSGQALGGHKRCHWVGDEDALSNSYPFNNNYACVLDLNLPPPLENERSSSHDDLVLDLRLGI